jgi:hypothetical protein
MIRFGAPDDMRWVAALVEVRTSAFDGRADLVCRVSQGWLAENCGDPAPGAGSLAAARAHHAEITDLLSLKIASGALEPDGSVLLRTGAPARRSAL